MGSMLYSRPRRSASTSFQHSDDFPRVLRAGRRDAGDAAVLRRQAAAPRRHRVLPDGRFLRDVLRGRADRGARARADAHLALQGCQRRRDSDVRRAAPRRRHLHRPAGPKGLPGRGLRAGRGSAQGQGARPPRSRPRRLARHADRQQLSGGARAGADRRPRPVGRRAWPRRGAARSVDRRVHDGRVRRRRPAASRSSTSSRSCGRASCSCPRPSAPPRRCSATSICGARHPRRRLGLRLRAGAAHA